MKRSIRYFYISYVGNDSINTKNEIIIIVKKVIILL